MPLISAVKEVVETVPFLGIYQSLSKTWSLQIERKTKLEERKKPLISIVKGEAEIVPFLGISHPLSKTWSLQIEREKKKKASDFSL